MVVQIQLYFSAEFASPHPDYRHDTVMETSRERVTEAPVASFTGRRSRNSFIKCFFDLSNNRSLIL